MPGANHGDNLDYRVSLRRHPRCLIGQGAQQLRWVWSCAGCTGLLWLLTEVGWSSSANCPGPDSRRDRAQVAAGRQWFSHALVQNSDPLVETAS